MRIVTRRLAALGVVWFASPRINKLMEQSEEVRRPYRELAVGQAYQRAGLPGARVERMEEPEHLG